MLLDLSGPPANPSSPHAFGRRAKALISSARQKVADFFKAKPEEIIFSSGGTESINYFLRGLKGHVITTNIEHASIYNTLESLALDVTYLPVGLFGAPLPEQIEEAILPTTAAIILSLANSQTGVKIDIEPIAALAFEKGIPLLLDGVAFIGKERLIMHPGISAIALSAHKFHGPKGVGALFLRSTLKFPAEITGGGQENLRRAGTENLAGILGLAEALTIFSENETSIPEQILDLRMHFERGIQERIPDIAINGLGPRISNTSNIAFLGVDGETLLMQLDMAKIAVSHGSACSSGSLEPSRILLNMGLDRKTARSSIRFSFSRFNTREEIDLAIDKIALIVTTLRQM